MCGRFSPDDSRLNPLKFPRENFRESFRVEWEVFCRKFEFLSQFESQKSCELVSRSKMPELNCECNKVT